MYCPDFAITGARIKAEAGHTGDTAK
jgi:hypothetical protein